MPHDRLQGIVRVLYVLGVGRRIDLKAAESHLSEVQNQAFRHKRLAALGESIPPSRMRWDTEPLLCGQHETNSEVEVAMYEQGALCVVWSIAINTSLKELAEISALLYERHEFLARSRQIAQEVSGLISECIERPQLTEHVEDYVVFQVQTVEDAEGFLGRMRTELAQLLRAESGDLAEQEIADATARPVSYRRGDLCLVDWLAAFLMGEDTEDERMVLEFATVELLLLRNLDAHLDRAIKQAYELLSRPRNRLRGLIGKGKELENIGHIQANDALSHEGIDNALKLFGDDYLARLHRTASGRFHLENWDRSIQRKLGVLRTIYESLSDIAAHSRAEALEWIIIVLIAIDIVIYLL